MENSRNNKPYNVTIIYDTPKEAEIVTHPVPETVVAGIGAKKTLVPWQIAALFGVVFTLLWTGGAFSWLWGGEKNTAGNGQETAPLPKNPFEGISVEASAALVFDIQKQEVLYAKNEETQLPLASITKLMTALIAEETLPKEVAVVVGKEAIAEEGDNGLLVGERWRKDDLIALTLLASSNDGAHALASAVEAFQKENETSATPNQSSQSSDGTPVVEQSSLRGTAGQASQEIPFVEMMNARAKDLGMNQTYFLNAAGLDAQKNESGAYGSARDVAALLEYILRTSPGIFAATPYEKMTFTSRDGIAHNAKNTNEQMAAIPGLVASKTGFTDLAGGNLAIIFEAGPMYPVAVVVLGSSVEGRFNDVAHLVSATLARLNQR
ncbi:MAG: D-alanyl-D-alanine carboxypeptidase [Parcubacteria group bacterium]|nr:D-alanyl-D-alanine carboxypeptidase [Parcubacteria group bacterium]